MKKIVKSAKDAVKNLVNEKKRQTQEDIIADLVKKQKEWLVSIFGTDDPSEYGMILVQLNAGASKGVCAKQLQAGDVAWRCLDCEKDPTCIICKECFEKGDHRGHRVQLKRNVGGCCDCGDPEAWDEKGFCSEHKGLHNMDPKEMLGKMPNIIKDSAIQVFNEIGHELKSLCMRLEDYQNSCHEIGMSDHRFKETMAKCIKMIFRFLAVRIEECPHFLHITAMALCRIMFDKEQRVTESHSCCLRCYLDDPEEKELEQQVVKAKLENDSFCSCTPMDLCLMTNGLLDNEGRDLVYNFFFKMFQSYKFKQHLTLSFASNYGSIINKTQDSEHEISSIGVQVLTSSEMSMIIYKEERLLEIILDTFKKKLAQFRLSPHDDELYWNIFTILHDIKYMARPECLPYCVSSTKFIEGLLSVLATVYFMDVKQNQTEMIMYDHQGAMNDKLLNLEIYFIKILMPYLREVPTSNIQKNRSILRTFVVEFQKLTQQFRNDDYGDKGFYNLPLNRLFAYYLVRLLLNEGLDAVNTEDDESLQDKLMRILIKYLEGGDKLQKPLQDTTMKSQELLSEGGIVVKDGQFKVVQGSSLIEDGQFKVVQGSSLLEGLEDEAEEKKDAEMVLESPNKKNPFEGSGDILAMELLMDQLLLTLKHQSFLNEISANKWIYLGELLNYYPRIYHSMSGMHLYDMASLQIVLAFQGDEPAFKLPFDELIDQSGLDGQLQKILTGLQALQLPVKDLMLYDKDKLRMELTFFLRLIIQTCVQDIPYICQLHNRSQEKAEKKQEIETEQSKRAKDLWMKAHTRQAVHLLMANKPGAPIEALRSSMPDYLVKDENFQEKLFEISEQARDKSNQITFRLKDQFIPWFEPFFQSGINTSQESFQMFEQHYKNKVADKGVNDIVGDYLDNYEFATGLNFALAENLARSKILYIAIPIISAFLKQKTGKEFAQEDPKEKEMREKKKKLEQQQLSLGQLFKQIANKTNQTSNPSMLSQFQKITQSIQKELDESNSAFSNPEDSAERTDEYLSTFVDQTLAYEALKILVITIQAFKRQEYKGPLAFKNSLTDKEKQSFLQSVLKPRWQLVDLILELRAQKKETQLTKILEFVLENLVRLDPVGLQRVADQLGTQISEPEQIAETSQSQDKSKSKDALAKKKAKLMASMKKKGKKQLENLDKDNATVVKTETKDQAQCETCAICNEELRLDQFSKSPFGNFGYIGKSNVLYHATRQTIEVQKKNLRNADLTALNEKSSLIDADDDMIDSDGDSKMADDGAFKLSRNKKIEKLNARGLAQHMNPYNGSGAVISSCKHFTHISCLQEYMTKQQTEDAAIYNKKISGLNDDEFQCPICKGICNIVIPAKSLDELPEVWEPQLLVTDEIKALLDFYVQFYSQLTLAQQGYVHKEDSQMEYMTTKESFLVDFKKKPKYFVDVLQEFILHKLQLIDLEGSTGFIERQDHQMIANAMKSLLQLIRLSKQAKHTVFDLFPSNTFEIGQCHELVSNDFEKFLKHDPYAVSGNFSAVWLKMIVSFVMASLYLEEGEFAASLYNLIRSCYQRNYFNFKLALFFRRFNGRVPIPDQGDILTLEAIMASQNENEQSQDELFAETALPLLRKLHALMCIVNKMRGSQMVNESIKANSNQEEMATLLNELHLTDAKTVDYQDKLGVKEQFERLEKELLQKSKKHSVNYLEMPENLLLLTPYFSFQLFQIPDNFMHLQTIFYKKPCDYCKKEVLDTATCLLTGKTLCWFKLKSGRSEIEQCKVGILNGQNLSEGLCSWHAKVMEGGNSVFLQTSTGLIHAINNGSSAILDSPYRNRFGEHVSQYDKNYIDYAIDEQGGGAAHLKYVQDLVLNCKLPNTVLQQRTNPDSKHKVFIKNIL